MCATCGCETATVAADHVQAAGPGAVPAQGHEHPHPHDHVHPHVHSHGHEHPRERPARADRLIRLEEDVLAKNDHLAGENRARFAARDLAVFNLTSSPGAGKTALLERLIRDLGGRLPVAVVEGDQETERDAERVRAAGARAVQVNTGTGCHLDAEMVRAGVDSLAPGAGTLVLIENVGNLVCPALFDLGERAKIVVLSVTEGEDKPLKYPHMFRAASALALTKIDLVPHLDFDVERCVAYARRVNPALKVFRLSAKTGVGMAAFEDWLAAQVPRAVTEGA